jgi:N-acetylglucosamine kinase-like BadF-type ATPase
MTRARDLLLGVDGGGTKTVAWLAATDAPDQIIGRATAGPSNIRVLGKVAATANLRAAIAGAFDSSGIEQGRVASACLGLAGVDRDAERSIVKQWAASNDLADRITVVHDGMPVLYAAAPDGCGIALISGTGSFAFGRNAAGASLRCGGWGPLFGDEGSGYAIAVSGLGAASRAADGRGPQTLLLDKFLEHLDLRQPSELISTIYSNEVDRSTIASYAEVVFNASDAGDSVAAGIVQRAACDLAELVLVIARELAMTDAPISLGMTGGILLNRTDMVDALQSDLARHDAQIKPAIVRDAVVGAIRIAHHELSS